MKDKIKAFFSGIGYGISTAIPGLSGGTLLVICGCYDIVCQALALNIKSIKKNSLFLIIFAVGAAVGIVGLAHAITFMFERIPLITNMIFAALILIALPAVIKNITAEGKVSAWCIVPAICGYALVVVLFTAEMTGISNVKESVNPLMLIVSAAFAGISSIIPGVSGSFILVMSGTYETVITAVRDFDFVILAFVAIGAAAGLVGGSRLITFLLKRVHAMVYSAIFGLIVASALMLIADSLLNSHLHFHCLFGIMGKTT